MCRGPFVFVVVFDMFKKSVEVNDGLETYSGMDLRSSFRSRMEIDYKTYVAPWFTRGNPISFMIRLVTCVSTITKKSRTQWPSALPSPQAWYHVRI